MQLWILLNCQVGAPANSSMWEEMQMQLRFEAGFRIILEDPAVKAVLINIFGGIVRCDRVAQGVVDAYKAIVILRFR